MSMNRVVLLCLPLLLAVTAKAQVSAGISITDEGVKSFYLAIGQTYRVPEREVVVIRERRIPDEELPVVFFIASRARVKPEVVVDLRLSGKSWMDITLHYHLRPSVYYIALDCDPGPEYGRAYGHWKRPRKEWNRIRFEDDDIVKMVNLRFVTNHYGLKPSEVIRLRGEHRDFVRVNHEVSSAEYRSRHGKSEKQSEGRGHDRENKHGKKNGHGNGHKGEKHDD